uniref:Uncharacterized protein n=1 Tax=Brassica oleracea TaxID=3712 RepID=A0A3P6DC69_BRAOL|nr:unnamed protein product [Brassica oleracea]
MTFSLISIPLSKLGMQVHDDRPAEKKYGRVANGDVCTLLDFGEFLSYLDVIMSLCWNKLNRDDGDEGDAEREFPSIGASNGDGDRWGPLGADKCEDDVPEDKELESVVEGNKDGDDEDDNDEVTI